MTRQGARVAERLNRYQHRAARPRQRYSTYFATLVTKVWLASGVGPFVDGQCGLLNELFVAIGISTNMRAMVAMYAFCRPC